MVDITKWSGLVQSRHDDFDALSMAAPVGVAGGSWSGPFRALASDGNDYFVKSAETCPSGQQASLAIEHVVAAVGRLIGAPVCITSLLRIPEEIAGWEPRPGVLLKAGLAHASRALEHADEQARPALASRALDDNRRRHVGVYALYDWCMGADAQWLYDIDDDRRLYSHDHGLYLPPAGSGTFARADLVAAADTAEPLPDSPSGLSSAAISEVAIALESVERASLADILNTVPKSWPVSDDDLEALGWFLEHRAPAVATRLRTFAPSGGQP